MKAQKTESVGQEKEQEVIEKSALTFLPMGVEIDKKS